MDYRDEMEQPDEMDYRDGMVHLMVHSETDNGKVLVCIPGRQIVGARSNSRERWRGIYSCHHCQVEQEDEKKRYLLHQCI